MMKRPACGTPYRPARIEPEMVKHAALILLSFLVAACAGVPEQADAPSAVQEQPAPELPIVRAPADTLGKPADDGQADLPAPQADPAGPEQPDSDEIGEVRKAAAEREAEPFVERQAGTEDVPVDHHEPSETGDRTDPVRNGTSGRPEAPSGSAGNTGFEPSGSGSPDASRESAPPVREGVSADGPAGDESAESAGGEPAESDDEPGGGSEPLRESVEPVLPAEELPAYAATLMPSGVFPVMRAGRPAALVIDLDSNGVPDLCVLAAAVESRAHADVRVLSDYARIFKSPPEQVAFTLELFRQSEGKLEHAGTVSLGTRYVLESFARVPLAENSRFPEAAAAEFLTSEGGETEWVIFPGDGSIDRLTLHDKPSLRSHIGDIDQDGIIDVVLEEQLVEAGTGHETFLTWFGWDRGRYREKAMTNIVRNLKAYLQKARELLAMRGAEEFLRFALAPDRLDALPGDIEPDAMLRRVFRPVFVPGAAFDADSAGFPENVRILDVLFPEIVENPFPLEGEDGYRFSMPLRIRFEGGEDLVVSATVELAGNPFTTPQFRFVPR